MAPAVRFHQLYDDQARLTPDAAAFSCYRPPRERCERSYRQLQVRSQTLAAGLRSHLPSAVGGARSNLTGGSDRALQAGALAVVAVKVPRTHEDFVPLLVALSRCNCAVTLMSTDLREKDLERTRNALIQKELGPCLIVSAADDVSEQSGTVVTVESLAEASAAAAADSPSGPAAPLCFLFTGGTTRGRCVIVTHEMVWHERCRYKECVALPPSPPLRVLSNTSVYWGASALGQLSIALAYGGCAVLCEAAEPDAIRTVILAEDANVIGLVPDQLRLLSEDPAKELPNMRAVFTWGERLPASVAEKWRHHPRAELRELLISTEYWLTLYAAPLEENGVVRGSLRAVGGVELLVIDEEGNPVPQEEVGELLIAGPNVAAGYIPLSSDTVENQTPVFLEREGRRYFRTRDLVKMSQGGLEFRGRVDMMTKDRGKWVDLLAVEEALRCIEGISDAALLPDPHGGTEPHAFIVLQQGALAPAVLNMSKTVIPRGAELHIMDHLPRHPVTRKVDVRRLKAIAVTSAESWPLKVDAPPLPEVARRASEKARSLLHWTVVGFFIALSWDARALQRLVARLLLPRLAARGEGLPNLAGFLIFPYMSYSFLHTADWERCWSCWSVPCDNLPFGVWGLMALALGGRGCVPPGSKYRAVAFWGSLLWAAVGALFAAHRRRLVSWPIVFWAGIGHRLEYDLSRWTRPSQWTGHVTWEVERFMKFLESLVARAQLALGMGGTEDALTVAPTVQRPAAPEEAAVEEELGVRRAADALGADAAAADPEPQLPLVVKSDGNLVCCTCGRAVQMEWPAPPLACRGLVAEPGPSGGTKDGDGRAVCWRCWPLASAAAVGQAEETVKRFFRVHSEKKATEPQQKGRAAPDTPMPSRAPPTASASTSQDAADLEAEQVDRPVEDGSDGQDQDPQESADQGGVSPKPETTEGSPRVATASASTSEAVEVKEESRQGQGQEEGNEEWAAGWQQRFDRWWWYNKTQDVVDVRRKEMHRIQLPELPAAGEGAALAETADPRLRRLMRCLQQVNGTVAAGGLNAALHGLDSLNVSLLTSRVRAEFGLRALSVEPVRKASNLTELLEVLETAQAEQEKEGDKASSSSTEPAPGRKPEEGYREYSVWFSPGQMFPMGAWVVRCDSPVDPVVMEEAARRLVDRHSALRAICWDSTRLLSYILDVGILMTLVSRTLQRGPRWIRALRRFVAWAIKAAWPRIRVFPRLELYKDHDAKAPFAVMKVGSQRGLTEAIRSRKKLPGIRREPLDIALIRLEVQLQGLWVYGMQGGDGDFVILKDTRAEAASCELLFVDSVTEEVGVLVGPSDPRWAPPPYGFPALLSARLLPGTAVVWLRVNKPGELVVMWKANDKEETRWRRYTAFRMPGVGATTVFSALAVTAVHNIADGLSYESIVGDLLAIYASLAPNQPYCSGTAPLAPLAGEALEKLQQRLFSAVDGADTAAASQMTSMRGSLWKCRQKGYGHLLGCRKTAVEALRRASAAYGAPLDLLLLALSVVGIARAAQMEVVELTMYVPVRDGPGEAGMVGLFADWRTIAVSADFETATVLGVVLNVAHILRTRRWAVYNCLKKPESFVVNFIPLDAAPASCRAGFVQVGEELWRFGENMKSETRSDDLSWAAQPFSMTIEEGDKDTWWLLLGGSINTFPPATMRRFVKGFDDGFWALLTDPCQKVHLPYPENFA